MSNRKPLLPVEHQEAWIEERIRALAQELDVEVSIVWDDDGVRHIRMPTVPVALEDVVTDRILAIFNEANTRFNPDFQ